MNCSISCKVPLIFKPAKAQYRHVPKGCVLVLGSFNYPFLLALRPVIGAISAGNCVVLKPSERSKYTSKIIELDPSQDEAHEGKGWCFYNLGDFTKAITSFSDAINLNQNKMKDMYFL